MFIRNLTAMVHSGIALQKILLVLSSQAKSKKLKVALDEMQKRVLQGEQLSDTMALYPAIFPKFFYNMIRTGEESGTLENVLSHLTLQLQREHDLRSKIKSTLIYPAIIVVGIFGIGIFILVLLVPNLAVTFKELQVPLPASTKMIIGFVDFLVSFWYVVIFLVVGIGIALHQTLRTKSGKNIVDTVLLRLPIAGPIVKKVNTAFFARTMSSLIQAGMPMVRSLEVTATVLKNTHFKRVLKEGAEEMRKGMKLSLVLSRHTNLYPIVVVQMVKVGEETGQTGNLLATLADFFEEEATNTANNLASIIEPILMLVIGAAVGFFAISMIQPMYYAMLGML